jgi:hypothetical protein
MSEQHATPHNAAKRLACLLRGHRWDSYWAFKHRCIRCGYHNAKRKVRV